MNIGSYEFFLLGGNLKTAETIDIGIKKADRSQPF